MSKNKLWGLLTIIFFTLLVLPNTAGAADKIELKLFKSKAKTSPQLAQPQTYQKSGMEFGLRLLGGGTYFLMQNDINDHLQGLNDKYNDDPSSSADSEFELINMGMDFSGEVFINFTPNIGIGIGAGYISAGKETSVEVFHDGMFGSIESLTYYPKFSAIPITFSLYFGIPLGSMVDVVLHGGAGYYLGTVNWEYTEESDGFMISSEEEGTWSAESNALGFHGGINFEFGFTRNFAFVIGAKGRYAKLTDLTGDLEWEGYHSWFGSLSGTEEDQTLWFGTYETFSGEEYPRMDFSEDKPTEWWWSDVRKAEINLSGVVFQAGFKITF